MSTEKIIRLLIIWRDKSIGDNVVGSNLPWGGTVLVYSEETTDGMIGSTGSAVCSSTSADVSYGWGASCGWGGDGACWVWLLVKKGTIPQESVTLGEEEKALVTSDVLLVTWCSWGLFSWLGWIGGHRHLSWYFWSLPICQFADTTTKVL